MNIKSAFCYVCFVAGFGIVTDVIAERTLTRRLHHAIESLHGQDNYRWTTSVAFSEETRFRPGLTFGSTARKGMTHGTMSFGPGSTQVVIDGN